MRLSTFIFALLITFTGCSQPSKKVKNKDLKKLQTAYVASGCFWCVEVIYESIDGVQEVVSGYAGGSEPNPTYEAVGRGLTNHAEAVKIYYDSTKVSFKTLVDVFYGSQDPTTIGQQPDFGPQYRSIIFYTNEVEKNIAHEAKSDLENSGLYNKPIVTEIMELNTFYDAEKYHQDYVRLNPTQPYVRSVSLRRLKEFKEKFPEILK